MATYDIGRLPSGLKFFAPLRTSLEVEHGVGPVILTGGGGGTIIDCTGTVIKDIPADTPRYFGARYSGGVYDFHTAAGVKIPTEISEVYPGGMYTIGDSQANNNEGFWKWAGRYLSIDSVTEADGGDTLANIRDIQVPVVVAAGPNVCVFQGGINNISGASTDPSTTMLGIAETILDTLVAAGITPVVLGVSPWGDHADWNADRQSWMETYNTGLESLCTDGGYEFIDLYQWLGDPADPEHLHADYELDSPDGLHWGDAADLLIARLLYYALVPNFLRGMAVEGATTNLALYSEDISQADWVVSDITKGTATATAPDGSSTVDKITASADDGTILQAVTASEDDYNHSVWLQRDTGTGWVEMTVDGGTTWRRVPVVDSWQRFDVADEDVTDPEFGVRLKTSGDAVRIWGAQLNTRMAPATYIPTTDSTASKPAELPKFLSAGNVNGDMGTMILQVEKMETYLERDETEQRLVDGGSLDFLCRTTSSWKFYKYGDVDSHNVSIGTWSAKARLTSLKMCLMWDKVQGVAFETLEEGPSGTSEADDVEALYTEDTYNSLDEYVFLCCSQSGTVPLPCFLRGVWVFDSVLTSAQMESVGVAYATGLNQLTMRPATKPPEPMLVIN